MKTIVKYFTDFFGLFFPELCVVCSKHLFVQEKLICTKCLYHLPKTNFHNDIENPVAQLFWGRAKIEYATAFFYFNKGSQYQDLMHHFKYHGKKEIGFVMGRAFGLQLIESPFKEIDIIIPVPLHPKKQKKRGYNQSDWIAMGLANSLKKDADTTTLVRSVSTATQTRKTRFERWQNVENIFKIIDPSKIEGKHILLVDDVVTTGSTLEACANAILEIKNTKVSIATLAVA
ncbi:MAG: amidophosphoribosyltransferase [Bacteroidetes bacterium GWF2_33_16]|nr:MAG: amidophosphoribosyltransferase [Bacteroidetes bacterium GWE2_32_14]OFY04179.1 MAG: amidophosphoribosyltransferase [Bacteroidetes bacterium GWF2_33_16]